MRRSTGFALTATDAAGNISPVSNVATAQTAYVPPPAVIDLSAARSEDLITTTVSFTAPGDGSGDTPRAYSLRYSLMPMDLLSFESATEVPVEVAEPGSTVTVDVVHGLEDAVIFFALRSQDDTRTWSPLSNIARSYPSADGDIIPPARIDDFTGFLSAPGDRRDDFVTTSSTGTLLNAFAGEVTDGDTSTLAQWAGETLTLTYAEPILGQSLTLHAPAGRLPDRRLPPVVAVELSTDGENFVPWKVMTTDADEALLGPERFEIPLGGHWIRAIRLGGTEEPQDDAPAPEEDFGSSLVYADPELLGETVFNGGPLPKPTTYSTSFSAPEDPSIYWLGELEVRAYKSRFDAAFTFTAPGDDGLEGLAETYALRGSSDTSWDPDADFESGESYPSASPRLGGELEWAPGHRACPGRDVPICDPGRRRCRQPRQVSNISEIVTPALPPSAPTNLAVTQRYEDGVDIGWLASGDDGLEGAAVDYRCELIKEQALSEPPSVCDDTVHSALLR